MSRRRFDLRSTLSSLLLGLAALAACDDQRIPHPIEPSGFAGSRYGGTFSVTGHVSECGQPSSPMSVGVSSGPDRGRLTNTDANGAYTLLGLRPGTVTVTASDGSARQKSQTLTITANQVLDFVLPCIPAGTDVVATGLATDDEGAPVAGASVTIEVYGRSSSTFFTGLTDASGTYRIDMKVDGPWTGSIKAVTPTQEQYFDYIFSLSYPDPHTVTRDVRLYRIRRINAGQSAQVTINPGDSLCGHDDELVCRTIRVMVPAKGRLTLGCEPKGDDNGGPGLTIVDYNGRRNSGQPWTVVPGETPVEIGMWFTSTFSQSCTFTTSFTPTDPLPERVAVELLADRLPSAHDSNRDCLSPRPGLRRAGAGSGSAKDR